MLHSNMGEPELDGFIKSIQSSFCASIFSCAEVCSVKHVVCTGVTDCNPAAAASCNVAPVLPQGLHIDPQMLTLSAGASAILDNLFFVIGNPGQGVLIPAPYYPAFDIDLQVCGSQAIACHGFHASCSWACLWECWQIACACLLNRAHTCLALIHAALHRRADACWCNRFLREVDVCWGLLKPSIGRLQHQSLREND